MLGPNVENGIQDSVLLLTLYCALETGLELPLHLGTGWFSEPRELIRGTGIEARFFFFSLQDACVQILTHRCGLGNLFETSYLIPFKNLTFLFVGKSRGWGGVETEHGIAALDSVSSRHRA